MEITWFEHVTAPVRFSGFVECTGCDRPCSSDEISQVRLHATGVQVWCVACAAQVRAETMTPDVLIVAADS
jgi:hypothetical protein